MRPGQDWALLCNRTSDKLTKQSKRVEKSVDNFVAGSIKSRFYLIIVFHYCNVFEFCGHTLDDQSQSLDSKRALKAQNEKKCKIFIIEIKEKP